MTAFDADILSDIWAKREPYHSRARAIPLAEQAIPLITAEGIIRGRFNEIRKAEAGRSKAGLVEAYSRLQESLTAIAGSQVLPYSDAAHAFVLAWKAAKIKVAPHDMRIAAIALSSGCTLVTRNARHFKLLPGLKFDIWH